MVKNINNVVVNKEYDIEDSNCYLFWKELSCNPINFRWWVFHEAGIINPNGFGMITGRLVKQKVLVRVNGNKYFLNK